MTAVSPISTSRSRRPGHFHAFIINAHCRWTTFSAQLGSGLGSKAATDALLFQIMFYYPGNWLLYCVYFNALLVTNIFRHFSDVIHFFRNFGWSICVGLGCFKVIWMFWKQCYSSEAQRISIQRRERMPILPDDKPIEMGKFCLELILFQYALVLVNIANISFPL